jgi:hypothetical protein
MFRNGINEKIFFCIMKLWWVRVFKLEEKKKKYLGFCADFIVFYNV